MSTTHGTVRPEGTEGNPSLQCVEAPLRFKGLSFRLEPSCPSLSMTMTMSMSMSVSVSVSVSLSHFHSPSHTSSPLSCLPSSLLVSPFTIISSPSISLPISRQSTEHLYWTQPPLQTVRLSKPHFPNPTPKSPLATPPRAAAQAPQCQTKSWRPSYCCPHP